MLKAIAIVAAVLAGLALLVYGGFLLVASAAFDLGWGIVIALVVIFIALVLLVWAKRQ